MLQKLMKEIRLSACLMTVAGSAILAFGLYHVHSMSGVTEGGVLGLNLLLEHWFHISPSVTNFVASGICYLMGWRLLGRTFLFYSGLSAVSFSVAYRILEQFPPLWPQLYQHPLLAAVLGALFVGIGTGLVVRVGGATSGDDALAMCLSQVTRVPIQWVYLISDIAILVLSLSYIPLRRILYSLLTVVLSGQLIGFVQSFGQGKTESKTA